MNTYLYYATLSRFRTAIFYKSSSFYQLLIGKRTVSTLYWGLTHQSLSEFAFFRSFSKKQWQLFLDKAVERGDLQVTSADHYTLTEKGLTAHQLYFSNKVTLQHYNGLLWRDNGKVYVQALLLATQIVSEYYHEEKHYYPIISNQPIQRLVKKWFIKNKKDSHFARNFGREWWYILEKMPSIESDILAAYLTGHQQFGQSKSQLVEAFHLENEWEAQFVLRDAFYHLIMSIKKTPTAFPLLFDLYVLLKKQEIEKNRTIPTYRDYLAGDTFEQIASKYHLKESTVKEHLLEMAIVSSSFSFNSFLSDVSIEKMMTIYPEEQIFSISFKEVQGDLPEIDFFTFRLYQIYRRKMIDDSIKS